MFSLIVILVMEDVSAKVIITIYQEKKIVVGAKRP
jgi:hypothetical protein